jgi:uncharacterized protein YaiI (UPF0178 family)
MRIWVDADACPKLIKEILFRAAKRTQIQLTLVSNHALTIPISPFINKLQVPMGFDVADDKIVAMLEPGDLVITADVPLADAVVMKGCKALNPRGFMYTQSNIKERLAIRNLSTSLRDSGQRMGGPDSLSKTDIQNFANHLDQWLARRG